MAEILPVNRTKQQARRYYDRISGIYDWLTISEAPLIEKGVKQLNISPGESILEVGCGTGRGLSLMARGLNSQGGLIGLDLSRKMLSVSRKKTEETQPKPDLIQGDATRLPVQAGQIDALFCSFTLELFAADEIVIVLHEFRRVMKPSGRLGVVALAQEPRNLSVRLYEFAHKLFPVAIDCRPIPLVALLQENGFEVTTSAIEKNWGLPVHITTCKKS